MSKLKGLIYNQFQQFLVNTKVFGANLVSLASLVFTSELTYSHIHTSQTFTHKHNITVQKYTYLVSVVPKVPQRP